MSKTATQQGPSGAFATSRRGGLTAAEIHEIEAHRAKARPTPWSALARRYGRCEADIRALYATPVQEVQETVAEPARKIFPWNEAQVAYLRARYTLDGADAVSAMLGCSSISVMAKASRLGISQPRGWNGHMRVKPVMAPERPATPSPAKPAEKVRSEDAGPMSPSVRQIITEIAQKHGLSLRTIMSPSPARCVSWPRQEAMAVLQDRKPHLSSSQIADFFGRERTTVLHAVRTHQERMAWVQFLVWAARPEIQADPAYRIAA